MLIVARIPRSMDWVRLALVYRTLSSCVSEKDGNNDQ